MDANQKVLTSFINSNESYSIPFFQRSYVWDVEQWQRLIADVIFASECRKPLFLGAVIFKRNVDKFGMVDGCTVIDGQQRLTTLFIFYKVLSLLTGESMWFKGTFLKLKDEKPILTQSHSNIEAFNYIMALKSPEDLSQHDSESQIYKAYSFFLSQLRDIIIVKQNLGSDGKKIIDYENLYKLMNFVVITLDNNEDEQQIFDTINSLGVKLTTGELLKNYLFSQTEIQNYNSIWKPVFEANQEIIDYWNSQISTGRLNKKTIDVFLYYYLQIKTQEKDVKGDKKQYRRWENLFLSYKTLIEENDIDKDFMAFEISEYAKKFMDCFKPSEEDNDIPCTFGLERISFIINNLDTTTLIPYVLYILTNVSSQIERNLIFGYLEKYIVRRLITDANNNNYSDLFTENLIGQGICSYEALKKYIEQKASTVSLAMPSDEAVEVGFKMTHFKNNKKALSIMYLLESLLQTDVHSMRLRPFEAYSLEHLMPKKWIKYWSAPTSITPAERDENITTLGNLAIITIGLNNSIRNYSWELKKIGKNQKPGLIEFAQGLKTVSHYLELSDWNEDTIIQRATDLAKLANQCWAIDSASPDNLFTL